MKDLARPGTGLVASLAVAGPLMLRRHRGTSPESRVSWPVPTPIRDRSVWSGEYMRHGRRGQSYDYWWRLQEPVRFVLWNPEVAQGLPSLDPSQVAPPHPMFQRTIEGVRSIRGRDSRS